MSDLNEARIRDLLGMSEDERIVRRLAIDLPEERGMTVHNTHELHPAGRSVTPYGKDGVIGTAQIGRLLA